MDIDEASLAEIHHDLNNLLAAIMNYASLASDGLVELTEAHGIDEDAVASTAADDIAAIASVAIRAAVMTEGLLIVGQRHAPTIEVLDVGGPVGDAENLEQPAEASSKMEASLAPHDEDRIRVLLVDDHEIFVHSLIRLLGSHRAIDVVGVAATGAEAKQAAIVLEPDVVLMDFSLPDGDGTVATEAIKARSPKLKVIMLTGHTDQQTLIRAISAGCAGFVGKTDTVDDLVDAIRAVHEGESGAGVSTLASVLLGHVPPSPEGGGSCLRPRELQVLELMRAGRSNRAIAEQLFLSVNTVRNHVQSILLKLGSHSKLEAVATAIRDGIVDHDSPARDAPA